MSGSLIRAADYVNAQRQRARLVAEAAVVMREVDVLVFPTARKTAGPLGEDSMVGQQPFLNRAFNVLGGPAISVCNGFSAAGMPISFQVAGRPFEDNLVLRVGDAVERMMGTRERRPTLSEAIEAAAE